MTPRRLRRQAAGRSLARVFAALLVLGAGPAAASAQAAATTPLTDYSTFAHWSHPQFQVPARRFANPGAGVVGSTRFLTEHGYPEVYAVLGRTVDSHARTWYQIGIPGRPNGRTGWVRDYVLGPTYRVTTRLVIDRQQLRATLFRAGRVIWTSPIGVGAAATPTPPGAGWIREKFVVPGSAGPYGPMAIGTSSYSVLSGWLGGGVIGIHGTNQPGLIPGRPSHGCVRVTNASIRRLYALMPIGTPFIVR